MKHKLSIKIAGMPLVYLTIFLSSFNWTDGANIIAFLPLNIKSSAIFSEAVVKTLVEAGHDVTYVTSIPFGEPLTNCTVIHFQSDSEKTVIHATSVGVLDVGWIGYAKQALSFQKERLCFSEGVKKSMDELKALGKKFDLLIIHLSFYPKCFLPIAQEFGIPYIGISALRTFWYTDLLMGNPRNIASTPIDFSSFYNQRTFWNRLMHTLDQIAIMYLFQEYDSVLHDSRFRRHFPNFEINQLPKMSLVFNNNHGSILPRPLSPNTIDIGGIHISQTAAALPQHLKTFLDEGERGIILFSLGSIVQSNVFDSEKRRILLNVFARLPERVIWKFSEKLPNLPPNVLITKWLPQRDILAHKNVKVFITHSGFFGTQEAIYEGKPLIMMPLNLDQPVNAALMYQKGVGEYIDLNSLEEEKLFNTIRQVIDNKKYRENMEHLSFAYKDRPMTPNESVIYWTKYVLRHKGATHLHSMAADMPFYQYFLLDVILFLLIICISLIWVSYFILKQVIRSFLKKSRWPKKTDLKKQD